MGNSSGLLPLFLGDAGLLAGALLLANDGTLGDSASRFKTPFCNVKHK